jgi:hypothetical protein
MEKYVYLLTPYYKTYRSSGSIKGTASTSQIWLTFGLGAANGALRFVTLALRLSTSLPNEVYRVDTILCTGVERKLT